VSGAGAEDGDASGAGGTPDGSAKGERAGAPAGRRGGRRGRGRRRRGGRPSDASRAATHEVTAPDAGRPTGGRPNDARTNDARTNDARTNDARTNDARTNGARSSPATSPAREPGAARGSGGQQSGARSRGAHDESRARREVSAGGVVYRVAAQADGAAEPLFLLIRDSYRNWGFPKGHLERGELPDVAAVREVMEETGLDGVALRGAIETIDWYFRFRGRLIHKICHFYLMETERSETSPQVAEGITACRWAPFEEAVRLVSYANAREVLKRAHVMVSALTSPPAASHVASE
jgi:8-oxo-dGTP pyrophosphatase MutT (NUDIX family)